MAYSSLTSLENNTPSEGAEIIQFPKKIHSELFAEFIEQNRSFIKNFDSIEDLVAEYSVTAIEDIVRYETQNSLEHNFSFGKLIRFIKSQNLSNNELSHTGQVQYEGYDCIWKIIYLDANEAEISIDDAINREDIKRKIALLLPEEFSHNC